MLENINTDYSIGMQNIGTTNVSKKTKETSTGPSDATLVSQSSRFTQMSLEISDTSDAKIDQAKRMIESGEIDSKRIIEQTANTLIAFGL